MEGINISLISSLSEAEKLTFISLLKSRNIEKGTPIVNGQESGSHLIIMEEGVAVVQMHGEREFRYNPGDYFGEIAFLSEKYRLGKVVAESDVKVLEVCATDFFNPELFPIEAALKITRLLAERIITYLHTNETMATEMLIEKGENELVEFKSTLRWNIHTAKVDRKIEHASLKTITAFLNSQGGTLLIGVNDSGEALGIGLDNFPNDDKALLHLTMLIKTRISMQQLTNLKMSIEQVAGKDVLRIDVRPSKIPVYMNDASNNDEIFYVRTGPSTSQLKVSEIFDYIKKRF